MVSTYSARHVALMECAHRVDGSLSKVTRFSWVLPGHGKWVTPTAEMTRQLDSWSSQ